MRDEELDYGTEEQKHYGDTKNPPIGWFFLMFDDDGAVSHQGRVIGKVSDGFYMIELYDWIVGGTSESRIVRIEDLTSPIEGRQNVVKFYDTIEWFHNASEIEQKRSDRREKQQRSGVE